jgi:putative transcriptional regulator
VVFICAHSDEGTMGLIINKATEDVSLAELLGQLDIGISGGVPELIVQFGGPVEHGRGFVLHSPDYTSLISTLEVDRRFSMTATMDILEEIAKGGGPKRSLMALGYAGWGPGQLADEIAQNGWLTCEADPDLVFGADNGGKWGAALKTLGVTRWCSRRWRGGPENRQGSVGARCAHGNVSGRNQPVGYRLAA